MSDNTIQDIKDKLDIATVIGKYVQLKKSGTNLKGLCPFHHEKSSSFMVSPAKQIWHCFGCGEGGDVLGFIKRYENVEFREALQMAAEMAGVELPQYRGETADKSLLQELVRINDFTASFFEKVLESPSSSLVRSYLNERGLAPETIHKWRIGFAPNSFDQLVSALQKKNVNLQLALQAGVLAESDNGKIFDRFRGRITFPIYNFNGEVVGFSARILPSDDQAQAKYINSPDSPIYNKSKVMFGLNFAKDAIRQTGQVVVMEGQMDVISAHQSGFKNTVATSGTALTEDQLKMLKRLTQTILFAFDNDPAGSKALFRAVGMALNLEMEVRVVNLKTAKDPDELIRKSPKQWEQLLEQSPLAIDHYLSLASSTFAFGSLEQKQYITDTILPLVRNLVSPVESDHYYKKISTEFVISESALKQEPVQQTQVHKELDQTQETKQIIPQEVTWEKEILGGLIMYPEFLEFVRVEGLPDTLISEEMGEFIQKAIIGQDLKNVADPLVKEAVFMVESNLENLSDNELALMRELKKSFFSFKLAKLKNYLQELTIAIKKAEIEQNQDFAKQLGGRFAQLTNVRFEIETKLREA